MEARARTAPPVDVAPPVARPVAAEAVVAAPSARRGRTTAQAKPVERPTALTRAEEYRYIRSDLRRLLVTAGVLLLVMLLLLLVIEL